MIILESVTEIPVQIMQILKVYHKSQHITL